MKASACGRELLKWLAPAAAVAIGVIWWGSDERVIVVSASERLSVNTYGGQVVLARYVGRLSAEAMDPPLVRVQDFYSSMKWWFEAGSHVSARWVSVPLWLPTGMFLAAGAAAWRNDVRARRRERAGMRLCGKCGYDLAGLDVGRRCPECGSGGV